MKLNQKFLGFFKLVFPSTWLELGLFLLFLVGYGVLGIYIAQHFRIIFDNRIPWDAYFSFDNRAIVLTGGSFEKHPLSNYFFQIIHKFALWISNGKYDANFRTALACLSNVMVSLSLIQIFKYLKNIIQIPLNISLLLVFFTAFFSTFILLSFTPETYVYTLFLLVLFNYYAALKLKKDQRISFAALGLSAVSIGGLTITNMVKTFIPVAFEKNLFWNWKKIGNAFLRVFISISVFILLYFNRLKFNIDLIFTKTENQYEKFSNPDDAPLWDMVASWFFGGNMWFPSFVLRDYHNMKGYEFKAIFMDVYDSWAVYLVAGFIFFLLIWNYLKNFKNKWVQNLMISFLIDILIHVVLKFGLHTSYIYGGHFIFVVPLLIGWLFYAYRNAPKVLSFLMVSISLVVLFTAMNNVIRMEEFFIFLERYHQ